MASFGRGYLQRKAKLATAAQAKAQAEAQGAHAQAQARSGGAYSRHHHQRAAAVHAPCGPEAENALLRGLPAPTVAWICGFLSSQDLMNLACVSRGFTQAVLIDPDGHRGGKLSVIDEGAALAAMRFAKTLVVRPPGPGETWLCALQKLESPLAFTSAGLGVDFCEVGRLVRKDGLWQLAVCGTHEMVGGVHCAEFTLQRMSVVESVCVGLVSSSVSPIGDWLPAHQSTNAWMLGAHSGVLWHGGVSREWDGLPGPNVIRQGDRIVLVLDLARNTLSVYLNGRQLGIMVNSPDLSARAPLCWAADVSRGAAVRIDRKDPPRLQAGPRTMARAVRTRSDTHRPESAPAQGAGWAAARRGRSRPWRPTSALGRFGDGTTGHMPSHLLLTELPRGIFVANDEEHRSDDLAVEDAT